MTIYSNVTLHPVGLTCDVNRAEKFSQQTLTKHLALTYR